MASAPSQLAGDCCPLLCGSLEPHHEDPLVLHVHNKPSSPSSPAPPSPPQDASGRREPRQLQFVLGTETGMVTAIVRAVRAGLGACPGLGELQVEIVLAVSPDAITTPEQERARGQRPW